jgi:hypothetical protein
MEGSENGQRDVDTVFGNLKNPWHPIPDRAGSVA